MGAEAEVQSATAETDVRVGTPTQVETLRMIEHVGVPVAGRVKHHHLLPRPYGLVAQLEIRRGRAAERHDRGCPSDEFLDRGTNAVFESRKQPGPLRGKVGERLHRVAGGLASGVV